MYRNLRFCLGGACRSTHLMVDRGLVIQQVGRCRVLLQQTQLAMESLPSISFHTGLSRLSEVENASKESGPSQPKNFVQALYNKVFTGLPKAKLKASGYILETHCSQARENSILKRWRACFAIYHVPQAIDVKEFMEAFDMPDTFYSWFLITELHIWLMGARLMQVNWLANASGLVKFTLNSLKGGGCWKDGEKQHGGSVMGRLWE